MKVIKELKGFSGSKVLLIQDPDIRVRKVGGVDRNLERYKCLSRLGFPIPRILSVGDDSYDMEYIPNLDIKNFLSKNQVHRLAQFIISVVDLLRASSTPKDYTEVYNKKLNTVDFTDLVFTKEQLIDRLPKVLPSSEYHGDLTLENILYSVDNGTFVLIDPLTSEYDSWVFDMAKLRQDLVCKWFIRNYHLYIDPKLKALGDELKGFEYWDNDYILILMLLRVLPYTTGEDKNFIIQEANKLWK
jgi:hypothetical protein